MLQLEKAAVFRQLHQNDSLLILPNTWDVLSSRLIASLGFPAIATASVAVAAINGYPDGEQIPLDKLLDIISEITDAVDLPVSVDFERGYAKSDAELKDNIRRLLDTGAVGLNIEDSIPDKKELIPVAEQCRKIELIRNTAAQQHIDIVINARTDIFLQAGSEHPLSEAIERGNAYACAGADCFYPIMLSDYQQIGTLVNEVDLPVNVLLMKAIDDLKRLEMIGVKRVSLGPGMLKYILTQIRNMAKQLKDYSTENLFAEELINNAELNSLIKIR